MNWGNISIFTIMKDTIKHSVTRDQVKYILNRRREVSGNTRKSFPHNFHTFPTAESGRKVIIDGDVFEFSTIFRPTSFFHYYMWITRSLTYTNFCLDNGVHFTTTAPFLLFCQKILKLIKFSKLGEYKTCTFKILKSQFSILNCKILLIPLALISFTMNCVRIVYINNGKELK